MVLERSRFAVTAVDEKAELGQWYWKGPDLLSLSLKRLSRDCGNGQSVEASRFAVNVNGKVELSGRN